MARLRKNDTWETPTSLRPKKLSPTLAVANPGKCDREADVMAIFKSLRFAPYHLTASQRRWTLHAGVHQVTNVQDATTQYPVRSSCQRMKPFPRSHSRSVSHGEGGHSEDAIRDSCSRSKFLTPLSPTFWLPAPGDGIWGSYADREDSSCPPFDVWTLVPESSESSRILMNVQNLGAYIPGAITALRSGNRKTLNAQHGEFRRLPALHHCPFEQF